MALTPKHLQKFKCDLETMLCCALQNITVETGLGDELEALLEKVCELLEAQQDALTCTTSKACDEDCNVVVCMTCVDSEGQPVSDLVRVEGVWIPFSDFTGTLDLGCVSCGEPIPTYEIFDKKVCLEDCTEGCNVFKVNTATDEIVKIATLDKNGDPTTLAIVDCPEIIVAETTACVVEK